MKKILLLSLVGVFSLSSFGVVSTKKIEKKDVKIATWNWRCTNGRASGTITCDCTAADVASYFSFFC